MEDKIRDARRLKEQIRARAHANRRKQANKDRLSRRICRKLAALPEYAAAATVMFYVDVRDEVRTRQFLASALGQEKQIVVPYCVGGDLGLFCLENFDELTPAAFGVLEPKPELHSRADRKTDVRQLDLIIVPGVAFDPGGGRLGHGKGYYDKLLQRVRADTMLAALAFECQLFPKIPMLPHDVYMHKVITENATYPSCSENSV